jgi:hypothetical protein
MGNLTKKITDLKCFLDDLICFIISLIMCNEVIPCILHEKHSLNAAVMNSDEK